MRNLRSRLDLLQRSGALERSPTTPLPPTTPALAGEECENERGRFLLKRVRMRLEQRHGPCAFHQAARFPRPWLGRLNPALEDCDPERFLFLDTETTGLAGGTGTYPFLIGLAYQEGDHLCLEQLVMREHAEEKAVLTHLAERLQAASALVTYNGKTFDAQLLQTRFLMNRMRVCVEDYAHLDLLHLCRRVWGQGLPDCRLETMETEVLGLPRQGDVPGWMVPQIYFRFLKTGDYRGLSRVAEHNRRDILAMVSLVAILGAYLDRPLDPEVRGAAHLRPVERAGLGRWLQDLGEAELARQLFELALTDPLPRPLRRQACLRLAQLYLRQGQRGRALGLWSRLLQEGDDPDAAEEMAKHMEHRERDFSAALALVQTALSQRGLSPGRRRALQKRARRLEGKLDTAM